MRVHLEQGETTFQPARMSHTAVKSHPVTKLSPAKTKLRGRPCKAQLVPGSYYARNQARQLAGVKARQQRLGAAYLESNREQLRRNRRRRRDRGQTFLPLALPLDTAPA